MYEIINTLANRYNVLLTIPATQSIHLWPLSICKLIMKRSKSAETVDIVYELVKKSTFKIDVKELLMRIHIINVTCMYDND